MKGIRYLFLSWGYVVCNTNLGSHLPEATTLYTLVYNLYTCIIILCWSTLCELNFLGYNLDKCCTSLVAMSPILRYFELYVCVMGIWLNSLSHSRTHARTHPLTHQCTRSSTHSSTPLLTYHLSVTNASTYHILSWGRSVRRVFKVSSLSSVKRLPQQL